VTTDITTSNLGFYTPKSIIEIYQIQDLQRVKVFFKIQPAIENSTWTLLQQVKTPLIPQIVKDNQGAFNSLIIIKIAAEIIMQFNKYRECIFDLTLYLGTESDLNAPSCNLTLEGPSTLDVETFISEVTILSKGLDFSSFTLPNLQTQNDAKFALMLPKYESILEKAKTAYSNCYEYQSLLQAASQRTITPHLALQFENTNCTDDSKTEEFFIETCAKTPKTLTCILTVSQPGSKTYYHDVLPVPYYNKQLDLRNVILSPTSTHDLNTIDCIKNTEYTHKFCKISPYNPPCAKSLKDNLLPDIFKNCRFTKIETLQPQLALNGILISTSSLIEYKISKTTKNLFNIKNAPLILTNNEEVKICNDNSTYCYEFGPLAKATQLDFTKFSPMELLLIKSHLDPAWIPADLFEDPWIISLTTITGISLLAVIVLVKKRLCPFGIKLPNRSHSRPQTPKELQKFIRRKNLTEVH